MKNATRYASTSAVPAIAAVLALLSTPALAQEVPAQPVPTTSQPAPVTVDAPPPLDTTTAPVDQTTDTQPVVSRALETAAAKAKPRPVAKAASKPAPARTVTHAAHASAPATPAIPAAPAAPATRTSSITPIVNTQAPPAPPAPAASAAKRTNGSEDRTAMELGGGALALLALGAGAFALSRRRRQDEEVGEDYYEPGPVAEAEPEALEPAPQHDPVSDEQPAIVAPAASAFAWGNAPAATAGNDDGSDRRPGETWVERAYRGPSPANPSVSLKHRLRRAAFFDKRERDVAAGTAEPVDAAAGLPDAMVEEQERELA